MIIYLGLALPPGSCALPNLRLHQVGFTQTPIARGTRELLPHDFNLACVTRTIGGIFSVALSLEVVLTGTEVSRTSISSDLPVGVTDYLLRLSLRQKGVRTFLPSAFTVQRAIIQLAGAITNISQF